jgi:glycosyltransferase involved in cell wall biosynthesis
MNDGGDIMKGDSEAGGTLGFEPASPLVVYWNNIPSPYFVERFNAVSQRPGIRFEAWFNAKSLSHRSWDVDEETWTFNHSYVPERVLLGQRLRISWVRELLQDRRPALVVSLFSEPSFMIGWHLARRLGTRTAFRVLAPSPTWFVRSHSRELVKRYMFRRADGLFVAGEDAASYVRGYGVADDRIFAEPQVSDAEFFSEGTAAAAGSRERLRSELGLSGVVFVYVGRLWWGKGVEHLIDAFRIAQSALGESSLLIVGDGEDANALKTKAEEAAPGRVVFTNFRQRPEVPALLGAGDVFVFPTLGDPYGLVVDEAMAAGLPVVSTTAAGEITARVREGETGRLVPPADPERLAQAMISLGVDEDARIVMGAKAGAAMAGRTPAYWAEMFEENVLRLLRAA